MQKVKGLMIVLSKKKIMNKILIEKLEFIFVF